MRSLRWLLVAIVIALVLLPVVALATDIVIVVYPIVKPTVIANPATNITHNSGTIWGEITKTGNNDPSVRGFEWGFSTGNYTQSWNETGSYGVGTFSHTATNLTLGIQVFYIAYATNTIGRTNSTEQSFFTYFRPLAPTDFTITQIGASSINISWTNGIAADTTAVRGGSNNYPSSVTDGYEVYNGTGTSVVINGLNLETNSYSYRAWSENSYGVSLNYAQAKIGGNMMMLFGLFAFCGIVSFLSLRSRFFLLKLLAGAAWIGMFIYWMYNPPLEAGSPPHIAVMIVLVGLAVAIPLMGLGNEVSTQTDWRSGGKSEAMNLFKFKIPDWMKGQEVAKKEEREEKTEEYRERLHRAMHQPKKENR